MKTPSQSNPWIGRLVGDRQRYRLDKRLAAGGMGEVFVAMDILLGKPVALKLLKDTLVASAEVRKRFEREVALCAALKSDHIVEVNDYGVTAEGYPFFVMEYLRGQSLGQLLRQEQRLPLERTVNLIAQVCDGLQLAHAGVTIWRDNATVSQQIKVVHRDLKPDNIFLVPTALGELVKILDFGIAKIRETQVEHTNLTNMFLGTFHYAAPEQLEVEKDLDGRADIYSLGMIIYEMLSGTDPFGLGLNINDVPISNMSWALAHRSKPLVPLRSQPGLSQISRELEAVVMRCLEKLPNERFASVNELKQALQSTISNAHRSRQNSEPTPRDIDAVNTSPEGCLQTDDKACGFPAGNVLENVDQVEPHVAEKYNLNLTQLNVAEGHNLNPPLPIRENVAEGHNLNPPLPIRETQEVVGGNRKRVWQPIAVATTVAVLSLAYYCYSNKGQINQPEKAVLKNIQLLKEGKNYEECVNQAKAVPQVSPFHTDAQNLLNNCQRLAQDEKLLAQAKELARKNNFKDAIYEADKISPDSSFRPSTQQLINEWSLNLTKQAEERYKQSFNLRDIENAIDITKAIPKTSSVAQGAEKMSERWRIEWNNNENDLKAAHKALEQGKWQEAIDRTNKVRLLGQEVKRNTPYWQNKMKPIIEMAQKHIAVGEDWGSRTNNTFQPQLPPPQPLPPPVPYLSRPPVKAQLKQPVPHLSRPPVKAQLRQPVPHLSRPPVKAQPIHQPPRNTLPPIQLSPEGQRILCQQFPLNSRCSSKRE